MPTFWSSQFLFGKFYQNPNPNSAALTSTPAWEFQNAVGIFMEWYPVAVIQSGWDLQARVTLRGASDPL